MSDVLKMCSDTKDTRARAAFRTGSTDLQDFSPKRTDTEARIDQRLCFAYGRFRAINAILAFDHRGPCRTDDGPLWLDLLLPYAVEVAHLRPEATFEGALRRIKYWLPTHCAGLGSHGFADAWSDLCNLRSICKSRHRTEADVGHLDWLPTAERIRTETRLTQAKHRAVNALYPDRPPIRGIGVIDPPTADELREANKLRMRATRLQQGVTPQWMRTTDADDAAMAKIAGCSPKTIQRRRLNGTLNAYLLEKGESVLDLCIPYMNTRTAHFQDKVLDLEPPPLDPSCEVMTIIREIASDPYVTFQEELSFV